MCAPYLMCLLTFIKTDTLWMCVYKQHLKTDCEDFNEES